MKTCPRCGTEFGSDKKFCPDDGSMLRASGAAGDLVGELIAGRYHVLKKLGEGGMGQIYVAEHVKIGRKDAVKVMHPALAHDAEAVKRFAREAANASRIAHPNVAAIYDFGESPDGLIYLAMEYVDGEPLSRLLEHRDRLTVGRAIDISRQVADALQAAHELGIVHRDLKPDNIMIAGGRDGRDLVKVIDFGIAKAFRPGPEPVTRPGVVFGTPEYMSPEQLTGRPVDGRSDIYSLGCILYQLLTGERPFPGASRESGATRRLVEPPPHPADINGEIPASLDEAVVRALATTPETRFQTAAEFGSALAPSLGGSPDRLPARRSGHEAPAPQSPLPRRSPPRTVWSTTDVYDRTVRFDRRRRKSRTRARAWWLGGGLTIAAGLALIALGRTGRLSAPFLGLPSSPRVTTETDARGSVSLPTSERDVQPPPAAPQAPLNDRALLPDTAAAAPDTAAPVAPPALGALAAPDSAERKLRDELRDTRTMPSEPVIPPTGPQADTSELRAATDRAGAGDRHETVGRDSLPAHTLPDSATGPSLAGRINAAVLDAQAADSEAVSGAEGMNDIRLGDSIRSDTVAVVRPPESAFAQVAPADSGTEGTSLPGSDTSSAQAPPPVPAKPSRLRSGAPAVSDVDARTEIQSVADEYLEALRTRDVGRVAALFKSTTDLDEKNERTLLKLLRTQGAEVAVVRRQVGAPRILNGRAVLPFRVKLAWRSSFGASRSEWVSFLAEFRRSASGWQMIRSRVVGNPDLD